MKQFRNRTTPAYDITDLHQLEKIYCAFDYPHSTVYYHYLLRMLYGISRRDFFLCCTVAFLRLVRLVYKTILTLKVKNIRGREICTQL
jgi:hypothetical protein